MFSKSFAVSQWFWLLATWLLLVLSASGAQNATAALPVDTNQSVLPNSGGNNDSDAFATRTPIQTFVDPASGQQYGRYVMNEPVPVLAYSYQEVKESVYRPKTVTENRTTTVTQYVPIQSQQLQLRNVPNWNPFAPPQQIWQYVPIVQYVPKNFQITRPVTFQRYEKEEVTRMVPVLGTKTVEVPKVVDRPSPNVGNAIANNPNFYQQAAQIAQANRNTPSHPMRPIGYPANTAFAYPGVPNRGYLAQAPAPFYPVPGFNPAQSIASAPVAGSNIASNQTLVIPAVPLRPNMPNNSIAGYSGPGGYPIVASSPNGSYGYATPTPSPVFKWPTFASGTGSLFGSSLFNSNRNGNYVASNTPITQPYLWGNSNQGDVGFRPNTSPYAAPQQGWGMTSSDTYRDPMQGGMPATVLR